MTDLLQKLCRDSHAAIERKAAATVPTADFFDVMRRAHALRPDVVDADKLAEAQELAPVVDIRSSTSNSKLEELPAPSAGFDGALTAFVADARDAMQRKVDERRLAPLNEPPMPAVASERPGGRVAVWTAAAVVLAAGLVAWLSFDVRSLLAPSADGGDAEQALLLEERTASGGVVEREPANEPAPTTRTRAPRDAAVPPVPASPADEAIELVEPESTPKVRRSVGPTLAELAARAEAQWRAKDLDGAQATLRVIVRRGGRSTAAEMAYADLFTLASQRSDRATRQRLWKRYLKKFPRGRFADDARAGLCRAAGAADSAKCWAKYRRDFPAGSYRAEADRHQGRAE